MEGQNFLHADCLEPVLAVQAGTGLYWHSCMISRFASAGISTSRSLHRVRATPHPPSPQVCDSHQARRNGHSTQQTAAARFPALCETSASSSPNFPRDREPLFPFAISSASITLLPSNGVARTTQSATASISSKISCENRLQLPSQQPSGNRQTYLYTIFIGKLARAFGAFRCPVLPSPTIPGGGGVDLAGGV